jgi:transposase
VFLVQPYERSRRKTDRRDANQLGELLWLNRHRLLAGKPIQGLRQVRIPTPQEREDRRLTAVRCNLGRQRTRVVNQIHHLLLRHNLHQECPTRGLRTKAARRWLKQLPLSLTDRLELDQSLERWELCEKHLAQLDLRIQVRQAEHPTANIVASLPGCGALISLAVACRIGPIERFKSPRSLANYLGLVPTCRNSGEANRRLGSITKDGSPLVRALLAQTVLHLLRRDAWMRDWYKQIKRRRGAKIARVAVMRRLTTILWHMLHKQEAYQTGGPARHKLAAAKS